MGAGIGAAFGLIGAVVQGVGAAKQVKANAAQMYAQAAQVIAQGASTALDYSNEAALHDRQGRLLRISGSHDAALAVEKGHALTAAQEGGYAGNGFALKGSIADIVKTTAQSAGLDIATMRFGAQAGLRNEEILRNVYRGRATRTLRLAGAEAADMVSGAKSIAKSATLAFAAPIIAGGASVLKSSFA